MEIRGREIKFLRTVNATCELAEMCPDGDISRIGEPFKSKQTAPTMRMMANIIVAMNKGYEEAKAFEDESYEAKPLKLHEVMLLTDDVFTALFGEATSAFYGEVPTIEVEPPKKNKKAKAETLD